MGDNTKKKTSKAVGKTLVDHNYGTRGRSDVIQQQPGSARKHVTSTPVRHFSSHANGIFDPCSECTVPDENLVQCDFCENSFCFACSNVTDKPSFQQIVRNKDENGLNWFCKHCRFSFPGVKKIDCRVTKVENKQDEMEQRLQKLENNGDIDQKVNDAMHDYREIEDRKLNIMCFGLAESHIEEGSEQQPRDIDAQKLHQIFTEILQMKPENCNMLEEHKPVRIGAYKKEDTSRCRPVKITVSNVKDKRNILQLARKKIKNSNHPLCKNMYFQPDLTKKQREAAFTQRKARREARANLQTSKQDGDSVVGAESDPLHEHETVPIRDESGNADGLFREHQPE